MAITIGATVITPDLILGYESQAEAGNIVHPIIGRADPDVTLRPGRLRTGTLRLGFTQATSEADSRAAEEAHRTGGVCVLSTGGDRTTVDMSYVVAGSIRRTLDDDSRAHWTVEVDYQEVTP